MVEHGARHLAFLSRSGSYSEEADLMIQDLRKRGTVVEVIKCDILSKEEVVAGVEQASRKREIKGVVHAAMVLEVCIVLFTAQSESANAKRAANRTYLLKRSPENHYNAFLGQKYEEPSISTKQRLVWS